VALGVEPPALAEDADSLMFCLSKGLSAPVGSVVCGSEEFVLKARRQRKLLGGGMRQAGVLAAAGIVALETMVDRLVEDHARARELAAGLARLSGIIVDPARVESNIVIFALAPDAISPAEFVTGLALRGVKLTAIGERKLRAVTHSGINGNDVSRALAAAAETL
jgi:threonine aldolase